MPVLICGGALRVPRVWRVCDDSPMWSHPRQIVWEKQVCEGITLDDKSDQYEVTSWCLWRRAISAT